MTVDIHHDKILILDFGSQYSQLIARRLREIGVYCELVPYDIGERFITNYQARGVILSGGPESTVAVNAPKIPDCVFKLSVPVLGICYGMQALAVQLGGAVATSAVREFGHADVSVKQDCPLFTGLGDQLAVWMSHGDKVTRLPPEFHLVGESDNAPIAAMQHDTKPWYGLQFHPEVTHTAAGTDILQHFVCEVCGCATLWTPDHIIEDSVSAIKARVGKDQVLVGLSGGVDSAVTAALIQRAVGDQLTCIFVDTGLLRQNEGDQVMAIFQSHLGVNVIRVNAQDLFYARLKGLSDPEDKRRACGEAFIRVFEAEARKLQGVKWLGQGTIYPDVIESAAAKSGKAHVIKTHHNVGGLPDDLAFTLIEPLRELFKDEVRRVGLALGLPRTLLYRHPFPGPGLAVRILGEIKPVYVNILQQADAIFMAELQAADLYDDIAQAFAVFLPVKSVGVKGDARCYEYVIALRAVKTVDFMTAHWAELSHDFLSRVSNRIMNEVPQVSRVVYDISSKPPATIEWE